jgi:hypothetical protein
MITLHIDFPIVDGRDGDVVTWVVGWLYDRGYSFSYRKYDYTGEWSVDIYTKGLEPVTDIIKFIIDEFGDELRHYTERYGVDVDAISACSGDECTDIQFDDLKMLEEQEHLEVEERWQKMIEPVIYGEDDDPEYQKYVEVVRWERLVGLRDDGSMLDVALEQEDYE